MPHKTKKRVGNEVLEVEKLKTGGFGKNLSACGGTVSPHINKFFSALLRIWLRQ